MCLMPEVGLRIPDDAPQRRLTDHHRSKQRDGKTARRRDGKSARRQVGKSRSRGVEESSRDRTCSESRTGTDGLLSGDPAYSAVTLRLAVSPSCRLAVSLFATMVVRQPSLWRVVWNAQANFGH